MPNVDDATVYYAVFHEDDGILLESVAETPLKAIEDMRDSDDVNQIYLEMMAGKFSVRRIRIETLDAVAPAEILRSAD